MVEGKFDLNARTEGIRSKIANKSVRGRRKRLRGNGIGLEGNPARSTYCSNCCSETNRLINELLRGSLSSICHSTFAFV